MSEEVKKTIPGYVRVATAAALLSRSRERIYNLIAEGRLTEEKHQIRGSGTRLTKVVPAQALIDYVRSVPQYDGKRVEIINKIRSEAQKLVVLDFSADVMDAIAADYQNGDSLETLANRYTSSAATMRGVLKEKGVSVRRSSDRYQRERQEYADSLPATLRQQIVDLHEDGHGPANIAETIGWGKDKGGNVRRALQGMGKQLRSRSEAQAQVWKRRNSDAGGETK